MSRTVRRRGILLGAWALCFAGILGISVQRNLRAVPPWQIPVYDFSESESGFGPFTLYHRGSGPDETLPSFISFDHLDTQDNSIGALFSTSTIRHVCIDRLRIALHDYTPETAPAAGRILGDRVGERESALYCSQSLIDRFLSSLERMNKGHTTVFQEERGWEIDFGVDLRNVAELRVNDLQIEVHTGGVLTLGVSSTRAFLSSNSDQVVLRGAVTLRSVGGKILHSSEVHWDLKGRSFHVPSSYVLVINGRGQHGYGIDCDEQLQVIVAVSEDLAKGDDHG